MRIVCKRTRDKFARGTSRDFRHGHDIPITRSNIEREQIRRQDANLPPATSEDIVKDFIHFPKERHYLRASDLMD